MLLTPFPEERLDPRVKRTRALIENTFNHLLEEKGFSAITVQDITSHAEINRATFYAHYADKFALFESILRARFRAEMDRRTLRTCTYDSHNLNALMETVCDFVALSASNCKGNDAQFEAIVEAQVRQQVQAILEHWAGQIWPEDPSFNKDRSTAATWAIYGLAQQWSQIKPQQRQPSSQFTKRVLPMALALLHAEPQTISQVG